MRAEQNKHLAAVKEKEVRVQQLVAEIDNLNSLINGIEKQMLKLKKRYETVVEERNYTGIQLIDRNDELCILYEKCSKRRRHPNSGGLRARVLGSRGLGSQPPLAFTHLLPHLLSPPLTSTRLRSALPRSTPSLTLDRATRLGRHAADGAAQG